MESKDLAARILRAEEVSDYVRQISGVDFCMKEDEPNVIYIRAGEDKEMIKILEVERDKLPQKVQESVDIERVCAILNEHLESAKYEAIELIQDTVFGDVVQDVIENAKGDGFEEIGD